MPGFKDTVAAIFSGKNPIDSIKDLIQTWKLPPDKAQEFIAAAEERLNKRDEDLRQALLKEYELEVQDRASARTREAEVIKSTGHFDYMMWALAAAGIGLLGYILWTLTHETIPVENREMMASTKGTVEMIVVSIFSYYFGSSVGSRIKDMKK